MESLLLLRCNLQELCVLAILKAPLAHARLVLTPVDAKDCRDCEKIDLGFAPLRRVHWQWNFFLICCTFFSHQIFPDSGPKIMKYVPPRICCSTTSIHKWYCCHATSFFMKLFVSTVGDITTILGFFFLSLCRKPCVSQLWPETFSLLCSKVNWSCNLKSLPIKDSAQTRVVSEHLSDIYLTFTREPQHRPSFSLTRVWKFFQIHSI